MNKYFFRFGALIFLLASLVLPAARTATAANQWMIGDFIGDQSFTFGGAPGWQTNYLWNTVQLARVGQQFTPTLTAMNILYLAPFTCEGCTDQWLQVAIRKNTITGPILATSYPVQLDASHNDSNTRFGFPGMIHLKPGARYVIDVIPLKGNNNSILWYGEPGVDFYKGGNAIKQSKPVKDVDIWFEEGVIISVPKSVNECHADGWQYLLRPDNSAFQNQRECVRFVKKGK